MFSDKQVPRGVILFLLHETVNTLLIHWYFMRGISVFWLFDISVVGRVLIESEWTFNLFYAMEQLQVCRAGNSLDMNVDSS